jgi:hypothetical protein
VSNRDRLGLTPDLTTRDLWRSRRWARERGNFVYSSLWDFKSSFTCRKILRYGTFPLYFPSERKVCCGFLSPLKFHLLGRVLNPQPLGPMASTLTTTPPRRLSIKLKVIIRDMVTLYDTHTVYISLSRKKAKWICCVYMNLFSVSNDNAYETNSTH